ncbi:zinc chelation protein SecC, partial [Acinetobacter pittii]
SCLNSPNKEYLDAWALLAELETDIVFLEKNIDDNFSKIYKVFFYKKMIENWQSLFPYKIFFSMGFTVKYYLCSICSEVVKPRNRCKHKKGMLYNGELCFHIGGEIEEIKEISIVKTPMQKICIPHIDYDYSIVDYVSERLQHPFDGWEPFKSKITLNRSEFNHLSEGAICPCQEEMVLFKDCCFNKDKIEIPHLDIIFEKNFSPELENEIIKIGSKVLTGTI